MQCRKLLNDTTYFPSTKTGRVHWRNILVLKTKLPQLTFIYVGVQSTYWNLLISLVVLAPQNENLYHTGINLRHSPCYAGQVALVLNLSSGLVSPQYHLVFDNKFATVPYLESSKTPPNWKDILTNSTEQTTYEQQQISFE